MELFSPDQLSVHKFGGTSMGSPQAMQNSAKMALQIKGPVVIVVSAASGVTKALMHLSHPTTPMEEQKRLLHEIVQRHQEFLNSLNHPERVREPVEALLKEIAELNIILQKERTLPKVDALLSIGERLSSLIFSQVLADLGVDAHWFDIRSVMKTSDHFGEGEPLLSDIKKEVQAKLLPLCRQKVVVTQGYIGSTLKGETTTLGKESSDYSAALLAEAIGAHHFAIWTDIPGVFTTDPKITHTARPIKKMSMQNALALTEAGAKVLHPRTMLPAIRGKMYFFVGSSQGLVGGTWVLPGNHGESAQVCAINLRQEQILLTFHHELMQEGEAPLNKILACFERADIKPAYVYGDHLCTEVLIDDSLREFRRESLLSEKLLVELQAISPVLQEDNLQLIAIIGNRLESHARLRSILAHFIEAYNIRVISFGMSSHSLYILVPEGLERAKELVKVLHNELFEG